MVPEKLKNYMFNENDFFNEGFVVTDPEKHELVKKLAAMITDDIQVHSAKDITTDMPDYWILDRLLNKEQVKFMLSFKKKRTVKLVPEEMAKRNNLTPEEAEKMAEAICGLYEDQKELRQLSDNCMAFIRNHFMIEEAERIIRLDIQP